MPDDDHAEILARCEAARQWAESPEGQAAIAESLERAREVLRVFGEAERVDWETLDKPMTC